MDILNWLVDVVNYFFVNLPQYAALITSSVAITLFLVKEHKEKKKKIQEEKKVQEKIELQRKSFRIILGKEAFATLKQISFFIDLYAKLEGAKKIKVDIMPDKLWRQIQIGYSSDNVLAYSEFMMIPSSPMPFDHYFIAEIIKIAPDDFHTINMLNTSITTMCKNIDSCIGYATNGDISRLNCLAELMINGSPTSGRNLVKRILKCLYEFHDEMSDFSGYDELLLKINKQYDIKPYNI
ncbi:TPA: hypothetical protein ACXIFC_003296 [Proteus mirabilis]